jgi:epimerase transport system membrane fusion protein
LNKDLDYSFYVKFSSISIVAVMIVIFFWGYYAPLSSVAVATGKIVVSGQNKLIQHLDGGIVKEIFIKDGDIVKKGQKLIQLETTKTKAELEILKKEKVELLAKKSRLTAQKKESSVIEFPVEIDNYVNKDFIKAVKSLELDIFNSKKSIYETNKIMIDKKINRQQKEIEDTKNIILIKNQQLKALEDELNDWNTLYKEELTDKTKVVELNKEKYNLTSEIKKFLSSINKLELQIGELKEEKILTTKEYFDVVYDELNQISESLNQNMEKVVVAEDILVRSTIKSPIKGTVEDLQIFNSNAVIGAGDVIMQIVPVNSKLILEGMLAIEDIDRVTVGQKADIRFTAFNTQNTMVVEGEVKYISSDRKENNNDTPPYYKVELDLTKKGIKQAKDNKFIFKAGMPAEIMIKTGTRTMLSYIIQPFIDIKARAFNED